MCKRWVGHFQISAHLITNSAEVEVEPD